MDIGTSCHTTFSIVNRQSAIGNENLVFGLRLRAALCQCAGAGPAIKFSGASEEGQLWVSFS
jgi:hypothetical protein